MSMKPETKRRKGGFTIIETLIAAIVLGLIVIGMVSMIRMGREMDVTSDHHRQARAFIHAALERPEYHFSQYKLLDPGSSIDTVTIDPETYPKTGLLHITVSNTLYDIIHSDSIPYKEISMSLVWDEVDGPDTISVSKRISSVQ